MFVTELQLGIVGITCMHGYSVTLYILETQVDLL